MSEIKIDQANKLPEKLGEKLKSWIDHLSIIRKYFYQIGFEIPLIELNFIESLRVRTVHESQYEYYLDEVIKESFCLPRCIWNIEARKDIVSSYKSTYLSKLENLIYSENLHEKFQIYSILDPNKLIFANLKNKNLDCWMKYLEQIKKQKKLEAEKFRDQIGIFLFNNKPPKAAAVIEIIDAIADFLEIESVLIEKGSKPRFILRAPVIDGISMFLEWSDLSALRKWGQLQFNFILQESDKKIWHIDDSKSWPCQFSLGKVIPGGDWYGWNNSDWETIILGILVHLQFIKLVAQNSNASLD